MVVSRKLTAVPLISAVNLVEGCWEFKACMKSSRSSLPWSPNRKQLLVNIKAVILRIIQVGDFWDYPCCLVLI